MFEYNEENLNKAIESIKRNLTLDLLPKNMLIEALDNPLYGQCHNVSGCLYKLFGSKNINIYRAIDSTGEWYWWVKDKEGRIIDLTKEQYKDTGIEPPYEKGEKASILGFEYRKRVQRLFERVKSEMENKREGIFNYYD